MYKIVNDVESRNARKVTPFGNIEFEVSATTDDKAVADYFKNHIGYSVTEIQEEE